MSTLLESTQADLDHVREDDRRAIAHAAYVAFGAAIAATASIVGLVVALTS